MNHKILFVDDEENILKALQRLMRKSGYETFFASGGKEALPIIEREHLSVVVSDMRMPEMSGVELVKAANEIDRLSVKIILSGYSDIDDIMSAVNGGHIHSYITKPWQEADLMITLMNACEMFERRIREKQMLLELQEKNDELEELNENLEKIVQARTWEIQASNMLLNSIIRGAEESEILGQGIKVVSRLMGGVPAAIFSLVSGKSFTSGAEAEPDVLPEKVVVQLKLSGKGLAFGGIHYFPLLKKSQLLGVIALKGSEKEIKPGFKRSVNFLSGIILYLSQQQSIGLSSDLISSIDMLIEEADGPFEG
jgi:CheY-like chemotaxis protein